MVYLPEEGGGKMNPRDLYPELKDQIEAVAMLYIQSQDNSCLTPEELWAKYQDACSKIYAYNKKKYGIKDGSASF